MVRKHLPGEIFAFTKDNKSVLVMIIIISVLLEVGTSIYIGDKVDEMPGTADQISYHELAIRVQNGYGFSFDKNWWPATQAEAPTSHWSFLYTFYLVFIYSIFGVHPIFARILQSILVGIVQPLLTYLIAKKMFGHLTGLIAAAINAIYLYFVYYSATLMTESFYITAILALFYFAILIVENNTDRQIWRLQKKQLVLAIAFGMILSVIVLLRQLFLLIIPFLYIWIWLANRIKKQPSVVFSLALSTIVLFLSISPFTFYNFTRFNRFVLLNTNAGYAFFWANHPIHGTSFLLAQDVEDYHALIPKELLNLDEASMEAALLNAGLEFITDEPGRYIQLSFSRIKSYFMFWPLPTSSLLSNISRVGSFGVFLPFMVVGLSIWGFKNAKKKDLMGFLSSPGMLLTIYMLVYTGIHILTWALVRYRLPVDAVLIIFAGFALANILRYMFKKMRIGASLESLAS